MATQSALATIVHTLGRRKTRGFTPTQMADATGFSRYTCAQHLRRLAAEGRLNVTTVTPVGVGRPEHLYTLVSG